MNLVTKFKDNEFPIVLNVFNPRDYFPVSLCEFFNTSYEFCSQARVYNMTDFLYLSTFAVHRIAHAPFQKIVATFALFGFDPGVRIV